MARDGEADAHLVARAAAGKLHGEAQPPGGRRPYQALDWWV